MNRAVFFLLLFITALASARDYKVGELRLAVTAQGGFSVWRGENNLVRVAPPSTFATLDGKNQWMRLPLHEQAQTTPDKVVVKLTGGIPKVMDDFVTILTLEKTGLSIVRRARNLVPCTSYGLELCLPESMYDGATYTVQGTSKQSGTFSRGTPTLRLDDLPKMGYGLRHAELKTDVGIISFEFQPSTGLLRDLRAMQQAEKYLAFYVKPTTDKAGYWKHESILHWQLAPMRPQEALQARVENDMLKIGLKGMDLIVDVQAYLSEKAWKNTVPNPFKADGPLQPGKTYEWQRTVKHDRVTMRLISEADTSLLLEADYYSEAESPTYHVIFDFFLNREVLQQAAMKKLGPMPQPLSLETPMGTLLIEPLEEWAPWKLRDESKAIWRGPLHRTCTLLSSGQKQASRPFSKTNRVRLRFFPSGKNTNYTQALKLRRFCNTLKNVVKDLPQLKTIEDELSQDNLTEKQLKDLKQNLYHLAKDHQNYPETYVQGILVPQPRQQKNGRGNFYFHSGITISADTEAQFPATVLMDELKRYRGITTQRANQGKITLQLGGQAATLPPEGYALTVKPDAIAIEGRDRAGVLHGVQTLIQWMRKDKDGNILAPTTQILDWPDLKFRGMMIAASNHCDAADFTERAVSRFLARYKLNVFLYGEGSSGTIEWKSHPEIRNRIHQVPQEKARRIIAEARKYGIEIIPEVQTFGHATSIIAAHPELADSPFDKSSLALTNPTLRPLLTELIDEAIDLFQKPKYFHVGCDESYSLGKHPTAKGRPADEIFSEHIHWLHDLLKKRGCRMIMWHDMLLETGKWGDIPANSTKAVWTHPALDKIPRDIIIDFWAYRALTFPAIEHFQNKGFKVIGTPWFSPENNRALVREIKQKNALGFMGSSWMFDMFSCSSLTHLSGVEQAWCTAPKRQIDYQEHLQHSLLPPQISEWAGTRTRPHPLTAAANADTTEKLALMPSGKVRFGQLDFILEPGRTGKGPRAVAVGGEHSGLPAVSTLPIQGNMAGLVFLHLTNEKKRMGQVGKYLVQYADGTQTEIQLTNRANIWSPDRPTSVFNYSDALNSGWLRDSKQVWRGISPDGEPVSVQALEWLNPYPEKELKSLELCADTSMKDLRIALLALSKVERPPK